MEIEQIIDALSSFADYINNFASQSRERDNALNKLEEAVFWLTYITNNEEV